MSGVGGLEFWADRRTHDPPARSRCELRQELFGGLVVSTTMKVQICFVILAGVLSLVACDGQFVSADAVETLDASTDSDAYTAGDSLGDGVSVDSGAFLASASPPTRTETRFRQQANDDHAARRSFTPQKRQPASHKVPTEYTISPFCDLGWAKGMFFKFLEEETAMKKPSAPKEKPTNEPEALNQTSDDDTTKAASVTTGLAAKPSSSMSKRLKVPWFLRIPKPCWGVRTDDDDMSDTYDPDHIQLACKSVLPKKMRGWRLVEDDLPYDNIRTREWQLKRNSDWYMFERANCHDGECSTGEVLITKILGC